MPNILTREAGMVLRTWMLNQASVGLQGRLTISDRVADLPAGASDGLRNSLLTEITLSVNGDYYVDVYIGGVAALKVFLKPQFTGSADLLADIYTTYDDGVTALQTLSYSPAANMTDNTLLTATLAARQGEQWMRCKLTHSGVGNITFDVGEVCGQ